MFKKLFVGGLSWDTTERSLRAAFEAFGPVEGVEVIRLPGSGRSRGYGFVSLSEPAHAAAACRALNGGQIDGRTVRVDPAQEEYRSVGHDRMGRL